MRYFSYIVDRDYGFAPNPFYKVCTLAACKPVIRRVASVGDWIFGTGSVSKGLQGKLIYAMQVTEKLTFNAYWNDPRFERKRPVMNGSLKQMYGDNIYHQADDGQWLQENSHHALEDGSINIKNLKKDTSGVYVLASSHFYYFGKSCIDIPANLSNDVCMPTQGFKYVTNNAGPLLVAHLAANYLPKKHDYPLQFDGNFQRFKG